MYSNSGLEVSSEQKTRQSRERVVSITVQLDQRHGSSLIGNDLFPR